MKKVLIIVSSPRENGNSDRLCRQFAKGAEETGNKVETIYLRDKKINFCKGCSVCRTTHRCAQDDDMAEILDKVVKADVIVLSTPVYFYIMNGQMKTFIDRCLPKYEEISNKEFYFICTSVDPDRAVIEKTLSGLRDFTDDCLDNCIERGVICGIDTAVKGAIEDTPAYERAYEIAKNI